MIIDSHLHFGQIGKFNMPQQLLLDSLAAYDIDWGIVSNIEGCEFDSNRNLIPESEQVSQLEVNRRTLELVTNYPDKLRAQFWIKPYSEGFKPKIADFILNNQEWFVGLKVHPYHSQVKLTDERCRNYLEFANQYKLSVAVHTADGEFSQPDYVYQAAKQYQQINFILVHMGLGTDNSQAIKYIAELDNLYGDTTWVEEEQIIEAVKHCGSEKMMFGTDNPIDGLDTYQKYNKLRREEISQLTTTDYEHILAGTAKQVFKLFNK